MVLSETKTARRMPNGNFIAEDDIVEVKTGFIDSSTGIYEKIGRTHRFTARLVSFGINQITFDLSKQFKSNVIEMPYNYISSIERVEER